MRNDGCDLCRGHAGWLILKDGGVGSAYRCQCHPASRRDPVDDRRVTLGRIGVPPRLLEPFEEPARWPRILNGQGVESLESWRGEGRAITVYLYGSVGVGKTFLAVELLWRWIKARREQRQEWRESRFVTCREVVDATFSNDARALEQINPAGTLLLDDLGEGIRGGGWDPVAALISDRYNRERPTLITGNLSLDSKDGGPSITSIYPEGGLRIASRLSDGWIARVKGQHRRGWRAEVENEDQLALDHVAVGV